MRKRKDFYAKKAKQEGYRSRAAYKLLQIDTKFRIFKKRQIIIDLCGAPGGFSQVARDCTKGTAKIFLIDLARVKPIPKITKIIKGDITSFSTIQEVRKNLEKYIVNNRDIVVLADCSPDVSGNWATDHARQIWLAEVSLGISNYFAAHTFISKVFEGEYFKQLFNKIKNFYGDVHIFKPPTSRKQSAETYVIARSRKPEYKEPFCEEFLVQD
ncbi:MAG: SAM-dependent methyltransferase [Candidatus Hodarchaeales archaeon]